MLYKRFSLIFLLTVTAFSGLLFGCEKNNYDDLSVSLSETELTLYLGTDTDDETFDLDTATFEVKVEGAGSDTLKTVSYSFTNSNIVTLSEYTNKDGNIVVAVTAVQPGSTVVTVLTDEGNKSAELTINVIQEASAIEYRDAGPIYVEQGSIKTLNKNDLLNFYPENTNQKTVTYELETPYVGVTVSPEGVVEVASDAETGTFTVLVKHANSVSGSVVNEDLETQFSITVVKPLEDADLEISDYTEGDTVELASNVPSESMVSFDIGILYLDDDITSLNAYTASDSIVNAGIDSQNNLVIYALNAGSDTVCVELSINNSDYIVRKYIPVVVKTYPTSILVNNKDVSYWENNVLYVYDNYVGSAGQLLELSVNPITAYNTQIKVKVSADDSSNINLYYEDGRTVVDTYAEDADKETASVVGNDSIYVVANDSANSDMATITFVSDALDTVITEINVVLVKAAASLEMAEDVNVIVDESANFDITIAPEDAYVDSAELEVGNESIATASLIYPTDTDGFKLNVQGEAEGETQVKISLGNGLETVVNVKVYNYLSDASISVDSPSANSYVGETTDSADVVFNGETISAKSATLAVGSVVELETQTIPSNATIDTIEYESSDESVVKVTSNGNIVSLNKTTDPVLITVKVYGRKTRLETVDENTVIYSAYEKIVTKYILIETYIPIESISLNATSIQLYDYSELGYYDKSEGLFSLNVNVSPSNATYQDITWSNSNTSFLSLYENSSDISELEEFLEFSGDGYIRADLPDFTDFSSNFGITTISVRVEEFSKSYVQSCTVTIIRPEVVKDIIVSEDYLYFDARDGLDYSSTQSVIASALPIDAFNTKLVFEYIADPFDTDTSQVVSVDEYGNITPLRGGIATVRVIAEDSYTSSYEYTNYVDITVRVADGTKENPYEVTTVEELMEISNLMDKHYVLGSNIDVSSVSWTALGFNANNTITPFTGSLNGTFKFASFYEEYKITGLNFDIVKDETGLFAYAGLFAQNNGVIKNLTIEAELQDEYDVDGLSALYIGGIASENNGEINNSFVGFKAFNLDIESENTNASFDLYVGGLAGINNGVIAPENLSELEDITIGVTESLEFGDTIYSASESYEDEGMNFYTSSTIIVEIPSNITGNVYVGGIAGYSTGEIARMNTAGEIKVVNTNANVLDYVGGIVGYTTSDLTNVYSYTVVEANYAVGGIAGYVSGNVDNAVVDILDRTYSTENAITQITGAVNVGGVAGIAENSTITNSYVRSYFTRELSSLYYGDIVVNTNTTNVNVGGLVGYAINDIDITSSYASLNVQILNNSFDVNVGGLVGQSYASDSNTGVDITTSYSTGNIAIDGSFTVGGFIGYINDTSSASVISTITDSYTTCVMQEISDSGAQDKSYFVGTVSTTEAESYLISDSYSLQETIDAMEADGETYADEMKGISFYDVIDSNTTNYISNNPSWSIADEYTDEISADWYVDSNLNDGYPVLIVDGNILYINMPTELQSEILPTAITENGTDYGYSHVRIDELVDADTTTSVNEINDYTQAVIFLYEEDGDKIVIGNSGTNPNIYTISDIVSTVSLTQSTSSQRYNVSTTSDGADDILRILDDGTIEVYGEGIVTLAISSVLNRNIEDIVQIYVIKGFDTFDLVGVDKDLSIRIEETDIVTPSYETDEDADLSENVGVFYDTNKTNIDLTINGTEVDLSDDDYTNDIVYGTGTQIVKAGKTAYTGGDIKIITAIPLFNASFYNEELYIDVDASGDYNEITDLLVVDNDINGVWSDGDTIDASLVTTNYFKIEDATYYIDLNNNGVYDENELLWVDKDGTSAWSDGDTIDYDYSLEITLSGFELVESQVYLNDQAEDFNLNIYQGAYYVVSDIDEITIGLGTEVDVDVYVKTDSTLETISSKVEGDLLGGGSNEDYVEIKCINTEEVYEDEYLDAISTSAVSTGTADEYYLDLDSSGTQGDDEPVWIDVDSSGGWSDGDTINDNTIEDDRNYTIYKFTYSISVNDAYLDYSNGENTFKESVSGTIKFTSSTNLDVYDSFDLTILPEELLRIDINHFPGGETYSGGGEVDYYPKENADDTIAPGRAGVLKINLYPEYANVDYYEITSTEDSSGQAILFEQLAFNGSGYSALDLSGNAIDGGITLKLISNETSGVYSFDGNLYVRTLLSSNVKIGTYFTIKVTAFKDGVATGNTQSITLEAQNLPGVELTYEGSKTGYVAVGTTVDLELTESEDYEGDVTLSVYSKIPVNTNYAILGYDSFDACQDAYQNYVSTNSIEETLTISPFAIPGTEITVMAEVVRVVNGIEEKNSSEITLTVVEFVVDSIKVSNLDTTGKEMSLLVGVSKALDVSLNINSFTVYNWFDGTATWAQVSDTYKENLYDKVKDNEDPAWNSIGVDEQNSWINLTTNGYFSGEVKYSDLSTATQDGYRDLIRLEYGLNETDNSVKIDDYVNLLVGILENKQSLETTINTSFNYWQYIETKNGVNYSTVLSNEQGVSYDEIAIEKYTISEGTILKVKGKSVSTSATLGVFANVNYSTVTGKVGVSNTFLDTSIYKENTFGITVSSNTSEDNPIPIYNVEDFESMIEGENYRLMENITLKNWTPMSTAIESLDGNNKTITIETFTPFEDSGEIYIGLFDIVNETTVLKNLTLNIINVSEINLKSYDGVIFGAIASINEGTIYNAEVIVQNLELLTTEVSDTTAGLLVGENSGDITNSRVQGNFNYPLFQVNGTVGGFAGINKGTITSSYVKNIQIENTAGATTSDNKYTGGFVAVNEDNARISYSYVESNNSIGNPDIVSASSAGGFVHYNAGDITDTYSAISVEAALSAGFVYQNDTTGSITNTYSKSEVPENSALHMPFTGIDSRNEIQNTGYIYHCYYLSGNYWGEEYGDPATSKSLSEFGSGETLDGFTETANSESIGVGIWKFIPSSTPTLISANAVKSPEMEISSVEMEGSEVESYIYSSVSGSPEDNVGGMDNPLIIDNAEELVTEFLAISGDTESTYATHIRLIKDIDMSEVFGSYSLKELNKSTFAGILDGNGMNIENLSILADVSDETIDSFGLFKNIEGIEVTNDGETVESNSIIINLTLTVVEVSGTDVENVGALAGTISDAIIYNTNIEAVDDGAVTGKNVVGALAGTITNCELDNITSNVDVNAVYRTTELDNDDDNYDYGLNYKYCDNTDANLEFISYAGGIAGIIERDITDDYSNSIKRLKVYGSDFNIKAEVAGGVVGYISAGVNAYDLRFVVEEETENSQSIVGYNITGGVVGINAGNLDHTKITYTDEYQEILDEIDFGEEKGYQELFVEQVSEYFYGDKININIIGGLVGYNVASVKKYTEKTDTQYLCYGTIERSYSKVDVVNDYAIIAGGFIGVSAGDIYTDQSMATGAVMFDQVYTTASVRAGHMSYDETLQADVYGAAIIGGFIGKQLADDMMGVYTVDNNYEVNGEEQLVIVDSLVLNNWTTEDYDYYNTNLSNLTMGALVAETEQLINVANNYVYSTNTLYEDTNLSGTEITIANVNADSSFEETVLTGDSTIEDSFGLDDLTDVTLRRDLINDPYANWSVEFWEFDEYANLIYGNFGSSVITNETDLYNYIKSDPYGDFTIANDIYLSKNWTVISKFLGTLKGSAIEEYDLDGNLISSRYPTIYNLNIDSNAINTGFIGYISDATLSSFNVVVGSQIADPNNGSWVWNGEYANGIVSESSENGSTVGAISGKVKNSSIENVQVVYANGSGVVSSAQYTGGVVGYALAETQIKISDLTSYAEAYVDSNDANYYLQYTTNSIGDITVDSNVLTNVKVGGLVGYMNGGILNCNLKSVGKISVGGSANTAINASQIGGVAGGLDSVEIEQHSIILDTVIGTTISDGIDVGIKSSEDNTVMVGGIFGKASNIDVVNINESGVDIDGLKLNLSTGANSINIDGASMLNIGGLIGELSSNASVTLTESSFEGVIDIQGVLSTSVGGLVGSLYNCDINGGSYANAEIMIDQSNYELKAGGIVGKVDTLSGDIPSASNIQKCYALGSITNIGDVSGDGDDVYIGGLIGDNSYANISECFAQNNINTAGTSGYVYVGGITGVTGGNIENNYSAQVIIVKITSGSGFGGVGGLIGSINSSSVSIENCYTVSTLFTNSTLSYNLGALVGSGENSNITDCYYVTETNGLTGQTTQLDNDENYKIYGTEVSAVGIMNTSYLTGTSWSNTLNDYIYPTLSSFDSTVQNANTQDLGTLMSPKQVDDVTDITSRTNNDNNEYLSYIQISNITFDIDEVATINLGQTIYNGNYNVIINNNSICSVFNVENNSLLSSTVVNVTKKRTLVNYNNGTMCRTGAYGNVSLDGSESNQIVAGLVYSNNGDILESYADVNIDLSNCTGTNTAVGLVLSNSGTVWGCFAGGDILTGDDVDIYSLIKTNDGSVSESYSGVIALNNTGSMSSATVGNSEDNVYYDVYAISSGVNTIGEASTTSAIRELYTGVNNEIWADTISENRNYGYPKLAWINDNYLMNTGNGVNDNNYMQIPHAGRLDWLSANVDSYGDKYFTQTYNINMSGYNNVNNITNINSDTFTPIGKNSNNAFTGTYTAPSNANINYLIVNGSVNVGLFGYVSGASISNVTLQDAVVSGDSCVGGLVGYGLNIKIDNCSVIDSGSNVAKVSAKGKVEEFEKDLKGDVGLADEVIKVKETVAYVGGLIGCLVITSDGNHINGCSNSADVLADKGDGVSGIVGFAHINKNTSINIEDCYNTGFITAINSNYVAGLLSQVSELDLFVSNQVYFVNCYNAGAISGKDYVSGVVSYLGACKITVGDNLIINSGTVSGDCYVSGVVGCVEDVVFEIDDSFSIKNTGAISGDNYVGGIVGYTEQIVTTNSTSVSIRNTGDILGGNYVGGIVGKMAEGNLSYCVNTGNIHVNGSYAGGVIGRISGVDDESGNVNNSKNYGLVVGVSDTQYLGGIVGYSNIVLNISNCINEQNVNGDAYTGGIIGYMQEGIIGSCSNKGNILSDNHVTLSNTGTVAHLGGIAGCAGSFDGDTSYTLVDIKDCSNEGNVSSEYTNESNRPCYRSKVGGIVGDLECGSVYGSSESSLTTNTGNITGRNSVGGIIGDSHVLIKIKYCNNSGIVKGDFYLAGIIGRLATSYSSITKNISTTGIEVSNNTNSGLINSSNSYVAGIIGVCYSKDNTLKILNNKNSGCISAKSYTAGIISNLQGYRGKIYIQDNSNTATAIVSGTSSVSGIVGYINYFSTASVDEEITPTIYVLDVRPVLWVKANKNNAEINATGSYVGGVLGYLNVDSKAISDISGQSSSEIEIYTYINIGGNSNSGNIEGGDYTGGIVGYSSVSAVTNNYANSDFSITGKITNRVDSNFYGNINSGDVEGGDSVGGIIGYSIIKSYKDESWSEHSSVETSHLITNTITGSSMSDGTENSGEVSGDNNVGGIIGFCGVDKGKSNQQVGTQIMYCESYGKVTGGVNIGGIVGKYYGYNNVNYCQTTARIDGTNYLGTIIGYCEGLDVMYHIITDAEDLILNQGTTHGSPCGYKSTLA